jgi:hypothetical protein
LTCAKISTTPAQRGADPLITSTSRRPAVVCGRGQDQPNTLVVRGPSRHGLGATVNLLPVRVRSAHERVWPRQVVELRGPGRIPAAGPAAAMATSCRDPYARIAHRRTQQPMPRAVITWQNQHCPAAPTLTEPRPARDAETRTKMPLPWPICSCCWTSTFPEIREAIPYVAQACPEDKALGTACA